MNENVTVVSVSTGPPIQDYYTYWEFMKSLANHPPLILPAIQGKNWSGLGSKPKILYKAIQDRVISSKWFLFCDCYDIVFANPLPADIVANAMMMYKTPLVISCERNCFPPDLKEEYDKLPATSSFKYLNSGMILGETDAMMALLESMELHNVPDDYRNPDGSMTHINDQFLFMQSFLKQPVPISLDYSQKACCTLHQVTFDDLDFFDDKIRLIETGEYPDAYHLNGSAKTDGLREPILNHLNLL